MFRKFSYTHILCIAILCVLCYTLFKALHFYSLMIDKSDYYLFLISGNNRGRSGGAYHYHVGECHLYVYEEWSFFSHRYETVSLWAPEHAQSKHAHSILVLPGGCVFRAAERAQFIWYQTGYAPATEVHRLLQWNGETAGSRGLATLWFLYRTRGADIPGTHRRSIQYQQGTQPRADGSLQGSGGLCGIPIVYVDIPGNCQLKRL